MSKPPAGFPAEDGYTGRCGESWTENIIVDGSLPGDVRGRDLTHEITRVAWSQVPARLSWQPEAADELRDWISDRIASIRVLVAESSDTEVLAPQQSQSLEWLLTHAETHLVAVFDIFDAWQYRKDGAFPLSDGDTIDDFFAAETYGSCQEKLDTMGSQFGRVVKGGTNVFGEMWTVVCPTKAELNARTVARADIIKNFEFALQSVRCAEYWLWKARLVHQAGYITPDGELGYAPGAGIPALGFKPGTGSTVGLGFFAPNEPPGGVGPDLAGLPGGEDAPERAEGGPLITEPGEAPPPSTSKALLLVGLGALGVFAYTRLSK